jgi:hypothetical protein
MYFDYDDRLLVCTIDKVGSTYWFLQFLRLGFLRKPGVFTWENTTRDELRDVHYKIKSGKDSISEIQSGRIEEHY